jgi:quercetin dioxygenase-like cupin family protein
MPLEKVTEMVSRKAVAGSQTSLVQVYFKKGTLVPSHTAAFEKQVYVLQGALRFVVDGVELTVREGEVVVLSVGPRYQAESLDDTFVMVFSARAPAS